MEMGPDKAKEVKEEKKKLFCRLYICTYYICVGIIKSKVIWEKRKLSMTPCPNMI